MIDKHAGKDTMRLMTLLLQPTPSNQNQNVFGGVSTPKSNSKTYKQKGQGLISPYSSIDRGLVE